MFIYKKEQRYDPVTGKPAETVLVPCEAIDDYLGLPLRGYDHADNLNVSKAEYELSFKYNDDSEQAWYYDDVEELTSLLQVEFGAQQVDVEVEVDEYRLRQWLAESPYHYGEFIVYDSYRLEGSGGLMGSYWSSPDNRVKDFPNGVSGFGELARVHRKCLVIKLLKEKRYTPEQLGLSQFVECTKLGEQQ